MASHRNPRPKSINIYSEYLLVISVFEVRFGGLLVAPSRSAYKELEGLALDLSDVKEVLERGFGCAAGKRKKCMFERCLRRNGKVLRVVAARDYNDFLKQEVWVVVHASIHAWNKKWNKKFSELGGVEK